MIQVEITNADIVVDATLLGELLAIPPADVQALMRKRAITSVCERGIDLHEGKYRLLFFFGNRRACLSVDSVGHILQRSIIDFGERPPHPF